VLSLSLLASQVLPSFALALDFYDVLCKSAWVVSIYTMFTWCT
jgi:hypothetical protein